MLRWRHILLPAQPLSDFDIHRPCLQEDFWKELDTKGSCGKNKVTPFLLQPPNDLNDRQAIVVCLNVGLGNRTGVLIADAPTNTIALNVISSSVFGPNFQLGTGITIEGPLAMGTVVAGNKIGTNLAGDADLGNESDGVHVQNSGGNFANDREKASEAGKKGGENSHGGGRKS